MERPETVGHVSCIITVLMWGTTFISTKILLTGFQPVEILFLRFLIGFLALTIAFPHRLKVTDRKQEIYFALAGLTGICIYYLLENIALVYTTASNASVILSVTPFFTAILTYFLVKDAARLRVSFFIGFVVAMTGICLICFNGSVMELNPLGDILAILAGLAWALYSILVRKISGFGYSSLQSTRRIFAYGIVFIIPVLLLSDHEWGLARFADSSYIFNFLFLGLGASALCFVTWSFSVRVLGTVSTSVYIYAIPVITIIAAAIILNERITPLAIVGTVLTLSGLVISQGRLPHRSIR